MKFSSMWLTWKSRTPVNISTLTAVDPQAGKVNAREILMALLLSKQYEQAKKHVPPFPDPLLPEFKGQ